MLGDSSAPETGLYNAAGKLWNGIDTSRVEHLGRTAEHAALIEFGVAYLGSTKDRGDYRELMALALLLLDALPEDLKPYHVRSIGGTSQARWMNKIIIELKIVLFKSQFIQNRLMTEEEAEEHVSLVKFLMKYYIRQWLQCPGAEDAASNDLQLFHALDAVKPSSEDHRFAKPMRDKLDLHLWYLSEELVVFCLFSSRLSASTKALCAKAMKRHHGKTDCSSTPEGKLTTPVITGHSSRVWHLFGPRSWLLFHLFGLGLNDTSFLAKPVRNWSTDGDYLFLQKMVSNLQVVNDAAERAILLAKTIHGKVTYNSDERKNLILVIPYVREKLKKLTKSELVNFKVEC